MSATAAKRSDAAPGPPAARPGPGAGAGIPRIA
jgi:hypothetical protein